MTDKTRYDAVRQFRIDTEEAEKFGGVRSYQAVEARTGDDGLVVK